MASSALAALRIHAKQSGATWRTDSAFREKATMKMLQQYANSLDGASLLDAEFGKRLVQVGKGLLLQRHLENQGIPHRRSLVGQVENAADRRMAPSHAGQVAHEYNVAKHRCWSKGTRQWLPVQKDGTDVASNGGLAVPTQQVAPHIEPSSYGSTAVEFCQMLREAQPFQRQLPPTPPLGIPCIAFESRVQAEQALVASGVPKTSSVTKIVVVNRFIVVEAPVIVWVQRQSTSPGLAVHPGADGPNGDGTFSTDVVDPGVQSSVTTSPVNRAATLQTQHGEVHVQNSGSVSSLNDVPFTKAKQGIMKMSDFLLTLTLVNMCRPSTDYRIKYVRKRRPRLMITDACCTGPSTVPQKHKEPSNASREEDNGFILITATRSQIGLKVNVDGCVAQLRSGGLGHAKKLLPGSRLVAVDGKAFDFHAWAALDIHRQVRTAFLLPHGARDDGWSGDAVVKSACRATTPMPS